MTLQIFRFRLFCYPDGARLLHAPFIGRGWRITLEPDTESPAVRRAPRSHELVLHAPTLERAEYVAALILAADSLLHGALSFFGDELRVLPDDPPTDPAALADHTRFLAGRQGAASGLDLAAKIAAKSSHRRKYQYALFKMKLSYQLCSVHPIDLDPSHWYPTDSVSSIPAHHVAAAFAIQAAYSAIEELGLEIRVPPGQAGFEQGKWNATVLLNLRKRLSRANVDLSDTVIWHRRGTPTRIERRYRPEPASRAPWSWGRIRDIEVSFPDAIRYASRLRSRVAAHRLPRIAASLSPYDVSNVQHLARILMLSALRCRPVHDA